VIITPEVVGGIRLATAAVAGTRTIDAIEVGYADGPSVV